MMNFNSFKKISKYPFIWNNAQHNSKHLPQNKNCQNCKSIECRDLKKYQEAKYTCYLGYDCFLFNLEEGIIIFNGLIATNNKVIKSGRRDAKREYIINPISFNNYLNELTEISKIIDDGIRNNIREQFTLFHDVRSSYGIAFSNLESFIINAPGNSFPEKLKNCDQEIIDLYDSLDLVNSQLELVDVMVNPAAITQGTKKAINIYKLTHKLTKLFSYKAGKKDLKIEIGSSNQIPEDSFHDSIKLIPIILIENAIKYSESKNKIIINFEYSRNLKIIFSISSYGLPVPEGERSAIFEKQKRGSNAEGYTEEGIGMGLFIAKSIITKHQGTISYDFHEKGRGFGFNIFKVEL